MGFFGSKKKETFVLADNEFEFSMNFFKYIVNDKTFVVQLLNKKGEFISEENFSMRQIEKIEHKSVGGNRYRIEVKLANEKNTPSVRTINYNRKKEGDIADKFVSMLNERLG